MPDEYFMDKFLNVPEMGSHCDTKDHSGYNYNQRNKTDFEAKAVMLYASLDVLCDLLGSAVCVHAHHFVSAGL